MLWNGEPKIIRGERSGIEESASGNFKKTLDLQVSLTSHNPNLFKLVNFRTQTGQMIVSWSNDSLQPICSQPRLTSLQEFLAKRHHTCQPTAPAKAGSPRSCQSSGPGRRQGR